MAISKIGGGTHAPVKRKTVRTLRNKPPALPPPPSTKPIEEPRGPDPKRKAEARAQLTGNSDSTGEAFVKVQESHPLFPSSPKPESVGKSTFRNAQETRHESFAQAAKKGGASTATAEKMWNAGPGKNAKDPVTGFQTEADRGPTMNRASQHVAATGEKAFYVHGDIQNLGGMNNALGAPTTSKHVKAISGIFDEELKKVGASVTPFRGTGGNVSAVVGGKNLTQEKVDQAVQNAQTRAAEYSKANKLDAIPHPSGKANGTGLDVKSTQIRASDSVERMERDTSLTPVKTDAPSITVPAQKPLSIDQVSRGSKDTGFQNAHQQHHQEFLDATSKAKMTKTQAEELWQGHVKGTQDPVTGLLDGNYRTPTVQNAIEHVKANPKDQAVYVEMDVANLGGLNKALGKQGADDVFCSTTRVVQEEVGKVGGSVTFTRHGGDEFSAVIVGPHASPEAVSGALKTAQSRIAAQVKEQGLGSIPHGKHPDDPSRNGTGLHFGVTRITANDSPSTIFDAADTQVLLSKHGGAR